MQRIALYLTILLISVFFMGVSVIAEDITLTTYYPAPYGAYEELTTTSNTYLATDAGRVYVGGSSGTEKLNVVGNVEISGGVGIGVSWNPLYQLNVAGNINTTTGDVYKNGSAYANPDYVFDTGYGLMPLLKLKKYVFENRHLPNMPSTDEIRKEGVRIFEQNRLILEKLEEAYLYIFELQDRITTLEEALEIKFNARQ